MGFINCFDVVSMVVEEATNQFSPLFKLDNQKYKILEQYCSVIDSLAKEFNGESYEVDVDDIAMTISITLVCDEVTITTEGHGFYALAKRANSVSFSSDEGRLSVKFVFPSVWDRV